MLIVVFLFFLIFFIIGCARDWEVGTGCLGFITVISFIAIIICGNFVVNGRTMEAKIQMYSEENQRIEEELDALVEQYMKYEQDTYGELKNESSIALISLYPDLKADTLVTKQIEVFTANKAKITELKEQLIEVSNYKWWLYFGG